MIDEDAAGLDESPRERAAAYELRAPGPCGEHNSRSRCQFWARCAERRLACRRFTLFAHGKSKWRTAPLVPTRAIFDSVFKEDDAAYDFGPKPLLPSIREPAADEKTIDGALLEFRAVPGIRDVYVTATGIVIRFSPQEQRWLPFQPRERDGRLYLNATKLTGVKVVVPVDTAVAKAFIDNPLGWRYVQHRNGVATDNSVTNLYWAPNWRGGN